MKVAFIGCGGIAGAHMDALSQISNVEFAGMCDVKEEKAKQASEKYGGMVYLDYHKMFDEIEVNACYICIPPFAHTDPELACIDKNIPFFVEKPIHISLEKAKEIAEKVKEKGLITGAGYQDRYQDIIEYIKPFFSSKNNLGFFTGWWVGGMPGVYWWRKKEMSGGQINEQTTHIYDMARYLVGEPVEVYSAKRTGLMKDVEGYNIEDASAVTIYFENGTFGTIFSGCFLKTQGKAGLDFYFKDKVVEYTERKSVKINYGDKTEEIPEKSNLFVKENEAFIQAVSEKKQELVCSDYADALKTLALTLAANKSIETGKVEKVERL